MFWQLLSFISSSGCSLFDAGYFPYISYTIFLFLDTEMACTVQMTWSGSISFSRILAIIVLLKTAALLV